MATIVDYRQKRDSILRLINAKRGRFSIAEIKHDTEHSRDTIRDIVYRLKNMGYLARHSYVEHFRYWERTSLMPKDDATLIVNYDETCFFVEGRRGSFIRRKRSNA